MPVLQATTPHRTTGGREARGNQLASTSTMRRLLQRWAREAHGAAVEEVVRLPGHSGITFSFLLHGAGVARQRLVVKVPPLGVRERGSSAVLGQVPILQVMARHGVRVPRVRAWGAADDGPFGVPYVIVDHVLGSVLGDVFAGPLQASTAEVTAGFGTAIGELAAIHGVPWAPALASWSSPRTPRDEVEHWVPVLHKAQDPGWVRAGLHVREQLLATAPEQARTGVVHGDFHPGNWLFEGRRLTAVLDWESSSIGPQPLDLAWLCMVCDEHSWGPIRRAWMGTTPSPDWIAARYEQETGSPVEGLRWFRALAGYRLACLTAHFLRLHRTGRRPDPVWEVFADAFHALLERGSDLLSQP